MGVGNYLSIRSNESARIAQDLPDEESDFPKGHGLQIARRFSRSPDRTHAHGGPALRQAHGAGRQCSPSIS